MSSSHEQEERESRGSSERIDSSERAERAGRAGQSERNERAGRGEPRPDRVDRSERSGPSRAKRLIHSGPQDRPERSGQADRPDRSGKSDRPSWKDRSEGERPAQRFRGDRRDRFSRDRFGGERRDQGVRNDRFEWAGADRGRFRDSPGSLVGEIRDIDREIIRLVARRCRLLGKLPKRGGVAAQSEQEIRLSWESHAAHVSRDPRLGRELFALLRSIEVAPAGPDLQPFNLAPAQKPVELDWVAPLSDRRARLRLALAAAAGQPLLLSGVPVTPALTSFVKLFNQLGQAGQGVLRWEEDGRVICRGGRPLAFFQPGDPPLDKVIHLGEDPLNFALFLFLTCVRPVRLKMVGEGALKQANFAPLRAFLPNLGARLVSLVPGSEGLPARLETSALPLDEVDVPADLPAEAVLALCLSAPFRDRPLRLRLADSLRDVREEARQMLEAAGFQACVEGGALLVEPARLAGNEPPVSDPPHDASVPPSLHLAGSAALLALPAFAGGKARLRLPQSSLWPQDQRALDALGELLTSAGLSFRQEDGSLAVSAPASPAPSSAPSSGPSSAEVEAGTAVPPPSLADLAPVALVLTMLQARRAGQAPLPPLTRLLDRPILDDFLRRFGLARRDRFVESSPSEDSDFQHAPWLAPSAPWALALALGAFLRPNLKLGNPGLVSAEIPDFWTIYNSLPKPSERPQKAAPEEETAGPPARRRILASYMPESQAPVPLPEDFD